MKESNEKQEILDAILYWKNQINYCKNNLNVMHSRSMITLANKNIKNLTLELKEEIVNNNKLNNVVV